MANVINLGAEVAAVHRRFSKVHAKVFGLSYRKVVSTVQGHEAEFYRNKVRKLQGLEERAARREAEIPEHGDERQSSRAKEQIRELLLEYTRTLLDAIVRLKGMCLNLDQDGDRYRDAAGKEKSRFSRDKVEYEYTLQQLERLGRKLDKIFASY